MTDLLELFPYMAAACVLLFLGAFLQWAECRQEIQEAHERADRAIRMLQEAEWRLQELEQKGAMNVERLVDTYEQYGILAALKVWRRWGKDSPRPDDA